jgi:hypothetical protein
MDEAAATRRAALDAVGDVEPARLRERIEDHVRTGSMVPGVLTILSVRAIADGATAPARADDDSLLDLVERRAAGVQLIYDGLRLTRQLAHEEPWAAGEKPTGDLDVLVADVLVARGFYLLSRTEAAEKAVETVRAFGHDQTVREVTADPAFDANLEADVIELAIVAGTGRGETALSPGAGELAAEFVGQLDDGTTAGFPAVDAVFVEGLRDRLGTVTIDGGAGEGLTTSVDD